MIRKIETKEEKAWKSFFLYKKIYRSLGWSNARIFQKAGITDRSLISYCEKREIEDSQRGRDWEKLMAYCNGDSELLNAAYSNFTAEQISAFVEGFL